MLLIYSYIFVFNDTATTEIYTYWNTLSLHDALPIYAGGSLHVRREDDVRPLRRDDGKGFLQRHRLEGRLRPGGHRPRLQHQGLGGDLPGVEDLRPAVDRKSVL